MDAILNNPYAAPPAAKKGGGGGKKKGGAAEKLRNQYLPHEQEIFSFGTLFVFQGIMGLLGAISVGSILLFRSGPDPGMDLDPDAAAAAQMLSGVIMGVLIGVYALFGLMSLIFGLAMRKGNTLGRIGGTILAVPGLLGFPMGTILYGFLLYCLWGAKGKVVFSKEYQQAKAATPHIKPKTSTLVKFLIGIILGFVGFGLFGMIMGG